MNVNADVPNKDFAAAHRPRYAGGNAGEPVALSVPAQFPRFPISGGVPKYVQMMYDY